MMPSTYTPIASTVLTTTSSSIAFSSIPATYTDLHLICNTVGTASIDYQLTVNGDSGTNYSRTYMTTNGSSTSTSRDANMTYIRPENNAYTTNVPYQISRLDFMNYSNTTTFKTVLIKSANAEVGLDGFIYMWRSTAAISSMTIVPVGNTFAAGSTFTLYGIKAA